MNGKAEKNSPTRTLIVVLFDAGHRLSHKITEAPQKAAREHFRLHRGSLQMCLVPREKGFVCWRFGNNNC